MSTAGGLVFQGTADGEFEAYDAKDGRRLWAFNARHGIIGCPISYSVAGRHNISILAGYGGTIGPFRQSREPRLEVWRASPSSDLRSRRCRRSAAHRAADFTVHALDDASLVIDQARAKAGLMAYQGNCAYCHGRLLHSAGSPAPDLRESALALTGRAFTRSSRTARCCPSSCRGSSGCPRSKCARIYLYIRAGARQVLLDQADKAKRPPPARESAASGRAH